MLVLNFTHPLTHEQRAQIEAITSTQISAVNRFVAVNWVGGTSVQQFDWNTAPPVGITALPPVLYEGGNTLNPCSIDPTNGYNC